MYLQILFICKFEKNLTVMSYDSQPGQHRQIFAVVSAQEEDLTRNPKVFKIAECSELETQSMLGTSQMMSVPNYNLQVWVKLLLIAQLNYFTFGYLFVNPVIFGSNAVWCLLVGHHWVNWM